MELGVEIVIAVGLFVRPLAILLAIYTLATGLLGHPFWSMVGADQFEAEINSFKKRQYYVRSISALHNRRRTLLFGSNAWLGPARDN
jgi:uncharacterized membrane protein YphA (DoxX/SURF4 family)